MKKNLRYILILLFLVILLSVILFIVYNNKKKRIQKYEQFTSKNLSLDEKILVAKRNLWQAKEIGNIDALIAANLNLENFYQSKFDYSKSLTYLNEAYTLAKNKAPVKTIADICYKISNNYIDNGDYLKAHEFAIRTDSIEKTNQLKSAETLNLLGNIYEKTGLYIKSLASHYESLELQKKSNNRRGLANSYHNLANVYVIGERFDKAYTFYLKALTIYQQLFIEKTDTISDQLSIAKIHLSLGNFYSKNDSVNALKHFGLALNVFTKADNKTNVAQTLLSIGNLYFKLKDYPKARDYYLKSLEISSSICNPFGMLTTNINLARIYLYNNQSDKAIDTLKKYLGTAIRIGANRQVAEISEMLYYLSAEFPDSVEQTKKYATLFLATKHYLPNNAMRDSIIEMSVQHEVTLQKNEEIAREKYKKNLWTAILLSLLILVMISAVFIYYLGKSKQRRRFEKKLADEQLTRFKEVFNAIENERKRIAIDLHDSLGQMLSTSKLYLSGLEELVGQQNENNKKLYTKTINLLDESCSELRNIAHNIMPGSFIKYGLIVAIEELVNKINESKGIQISFSCDGFESGKNESLEIIIYRIIQEALNNILKHANSTLVNLDLKGENNRILLSISDNGKGMEDIELYKNKGLGWKSIFSRVQMLKGSIKVTTAINKGTKIEIIIPI